MREGAFSKLGTPKCQNAIAVSALASQMILGMVIDPNLNSYFSKNKTRIQISIQKSKFRKMKSHTKLNPCSYRTQTDLVPCF